MAKPKSKTYLPDPKNATGPYRPFESDPAWNEAWWWLGIPLLVALFAVGTYQLAPHFYLRYVLPEGYGVLEVSHFFIPLFGLFIAASLLLMPFVRARPFVFTVALIAAIFYPWLRACRVSLFLPATALVPTALGAFLYRAPMSTPSCNGRAKPSSSISISSS